MNIPISISGVDHEINESQFLKLEIVRCELVGDTYFITTNDKTTLSIHKNFYKILIRNIAITKLLDVNI
jgi:hypothetical protein